MAPRLLSLKLRSFLAADAGVAAIVGDRIHVSHIPQGSPLPAIWLGRRTTDDGGACMDDEVGREPDSETFDVEAIAESYPGQEALVDAIRRALQNARGEWDGVFVYACLVRDASDDYAPRSNYAGKGFYLGGLNVEIFAAQG